MKYWAACSGTLFDWPRKLVPYYRDPKLGCYSRSTLMVDSGIGNPGIVEEIARTQIKFLADVAVSPDVLGNHAETVSRTKEWIPILLGEAPKITRLVSLQGSATQMLKMAEEFAVPADMFGIGGLVPMEQEQREILMREVVPRLHKMGKPVHIFGVGTARRDMIVMRELEVDSFDSSASIQAAKSGKVFSSQLAQIYVGGPRNEEHKRALLRINCAMIQFCADYGFQPQQDQFLPEWYSEVEYA